MDTESVYRQLREQIVSGVYRVGDRLLVSLTAPSWQSERARITIRNGRVPSVRLL